MRVNIVLFSDFSPRQANPRARQRPKRGAGHPGNVLCSWGRDPNGNRTHGRRRAHARPRSMTAEAARRRPRPRWTMAGPRRTGQLTRQRSAAASSSPPRRHSIDSSTADHHSSRDGHTAPHSPARPAQRTADPTEPGRPTAPTEGRQADGRQLTRGSRPGRQSPPGRPQGPPPAPAAIHQEPGRHARQTGGAIQPRRQCAETEQIPDAPQRTRIRVKKV